MNRAYSLLHVKSVDPDKRVISGIATTPEPDRAGDVIEPLGVQFTNPLPLLLYHKTDKPVGQVTFKKPTKDGIEFEARIPAIDEPGTVKDRVDEAWQSVKAGLLAGVSIGFRVLEEVFMKETMSFRYLKTEVLELSLVAIPANPGATIQMIKSLDLAASGRPPSGVSDLPVVRAQKDAPRMKSILEQIAAFEATRQAKAARMNELMTAASAAGVTLDAAQTEEYDTLAGEVKAVDAHLTRLRDLEKANVAGATPIVDATDPAKAAALRGGQPAASVITVKSMLPKGTGFTRYAMAMAATHGNKMEAIEFAKRWKDSTPEVELMLKAAVAAGTTTDATWAAPLVPAAQALMGEFLELLRPATVIGRIPGLRKVPFNVAIAAQTLGGSYGWVGQGAPKPVTKLGFGSQTLGENKIAGIIVLTEELVRRATPDAEETVRGDMIAGVAAFMDTQFTDPAIAAVAGVSPASITNGTVAIASSGPTGANAETDIKALVASFVAANLSAASAVLLLSEANAFALSTAKNPLGAPLYPGMSAKGGTILGLAAVASQALGTNMILVDPRGILYADEGRTEIDISREASVQMDSAPDDPSTATTVLVSLWQNNLVGLRCERFASWARARLASVKYVSGAAYV